MAAWQAMPPFFCQRFFCHSLSARDRADRPDYPRFHVFQESRAIISGRDRWAISAACFPAPVSLVADPFSENSRSRERSTSWPRGLAADAARSCSPPAPHPARPRSTVFPHFQPRIHVFQKSRAIISGRDRWAISAASFRSPDSLVADPFSECSSSRERSASWPRGPAADAARSCLPPAPHPARPKPTVFRHFRPRIHVSKIFHRPVPGWFPGCLPQLPARPVRLLRWSHFCQCRESYREFSQRPADRERSGVSDCDPLSVDWASSTTSGRHVPPRFCSGW